MEVDEELIKELRFTKTTPYKYIVSEKLEGIKGLNLKGKMRIAFDAAMQLENMPLSRLCKMMNDYINENELVDAKNRQKVIKYLNIIDKVNELKYYLKDNLVNNIKYEEIPYEL